MLFVMQVCGWLMMRLLRAQTRFYAVLKSTGDFPGPAAGVELFCSEGSESAGGCGGRGE